MKTLKWQSPDTFPHARETARWRDIADQLRAEPQTWALVKEFTGDRATATAGNLAWRIRQGQLVAFQPPGAFEAAARRNFVFARYIGAKA